jgi:6,7-dimethyl-8-ribityllumazine synthase
MHPPRTPVSFHFDEPPNVMIIQACFYEDVAELLLKGAKAALDRVNATYEIVSVPGALEIPAVISFAMRALDFDPIRRRSEGFIALGCVLKGDTRHDEIVACESAHALQQLAIRRALAIGNGILTCNTKEQALERADPAQLDRGGAAADACLRMIELKHHFRLSPKRRWLAPPKN